MKKRFALDINALQDIFKFIDFFDAEYHLDASTRYTIDLAIEELFTNMVKYDQKKSGEVEIDLSFKNHDLIISLTDFNVSRFDINKVKAYDNRQNIEERPIGKLGIHLIRQMMDKVDYSYKDNNNIITLIKHMERSRV
jgi:anti-sigma regulatory factor (Ser/Thr protein kinase)